MCLCANVHIEKGNWADANKGSFDNFKLKIAKFLWGDGKLGNRRLIYMKKDVDFPEFSPRKMVTPYKLDTYLRKLKKKINKSIK